MARTDYGAILSTVIKDTSDAIREVNGTSALIAPNAWGANIRTMKSADDYENVLDQLIQEEVASAPIASFSDGANNLPLAELSLAINPTQSGSGDPAPDNIRPITGVSSVDVARAGKNLISGYDWAYGWRNVHGYSLDTTAKTVKWDRSGGFYHPAPKYPYKPNTQYSFLFTYTSSGENNCLYISYTDGTSDVAKVLPAMTTKGTTIIKSNANKTVSGFGLGWRTNTALVTCYYDECGVFEGSISSSDFEPYVGNTYTLDLDGTRYGGTIDIVDGEAVMTCDVGFVTYDGDSAENWTYGNNGYTISKPSDAGVTSDENKGLCNQAVYTSATNVPNGNYRIGAANFITRLNTGNNDVPTFKTYLSNNPLQVVYPLATPFTVNLGNLSIPSLLGQNNIWHDGNGETSCTYYANGQLYVEQHST